MVKVALRESKTLDVLKRAGDDDLTEGDAREESEGQLNVLKDPQTSSFKRR